MLVGEPYHLTLAEIGKLTPYQVQCIYFHPRDEKTGGLSFPSRTTKTPEQRFFDAWRTRNLPEWRIREKWVESMRQQMAAQSEVPWNAG